MAQKRICAVGFELASVPWGGTVLGLNLPLGRRGDDRAVMQKVLVRFQSRCAGSAVDVVGEGAPIVAELKAAMQKTEEEITHFVLPMW